MLTPPLILRSLIFAIWAIVLVGAFVLRLNAKNVNPNIMRYLAYLGYTQPRDLSTPPAAQSVRAAAKSNFAS